MEVELYMVKFQDDYDDIELCVSNEQFDKFMVGKDYDIRLSFEKYDLDKWYVEENKQK